MNNRTEKENDMTLPPKGWSNATGTADATCPCSTWKKHWVKNSINSWPNACSVQNCSNSADVGAHVKNSIVEVTWIVPMCSSCNGRDYSFNLKGSVTLVPAQTLRGCGQ